MTVIPLPSVFDELLAVVKVDNQDSLNFSVIIPKDFLKATTQSFRSGYYIASNSFGAVTVNSSQANLNLGYAGLAGADKTSTSTITLYYR